MFRVRSAGRVTRVSLAALVVSCAITGRLSAQVTSPWSARDIGAPTPTGSSSYDQATGSFAITAGGADIWSTSDKFHFVYQQLAGDVEIIARVDSITMANAWSKSGVMIRGSLAANAPHASAFVSAGRGVAFQRRTQTGGASAHTSGGIFAAPRWVRLVRAGTRVTAYSSSNGTTWTTIGSDTIALGASAYVGIATTSHNSSLTTDADVSSVTVVRRGPPSPQQDLDVGAPALRGSASYNQGTYTILGAGTDIWSSADQFHYVYQPVSGDVDVSVRVASIANTNSWAKAGVMIRESMNPDSRHASTFVTFGQGYAFQRRTQTASWSDHTGGGAGAAPGWVRLQRNGSLFTAYRSTDGRSWTVIGSDSIAMADTVYVGVAVTSHNVSAATTAVVDNLSISQSQTSNQPPTVTLTAPASGSTFTAPATITLTASASDPEGQLSRVEFYAGPTLLNSDATAPYSVAWSSVAAGTYTLTAVAYDAAGARTTSAPVTVTVGAVTTPPRYVVFDASPDHATLVTSYRFDVFASGANPNTAIPLGTVDLGKPTPDANGQITSDQAAFFSALATGNYLATVSAIGSAGTSRSTAVTFTR